MTFSLSSTLSLSIKSSLLSRANHAKHNYFWCIIIWSELISILYIWMDMKETKIFEYGEIPRMGFFSVSGTV